MLEVNPTLPSIFKHLPATNMLCGRSKMSSSLPFSAVMKEDDATQLTYGESASSPA